MSALVPNLGDLLADLGEESPGAAVVAVFAAPDLPTARSALRALLESWEAPEPGVPRMSEENE